MFSLPKILTVTQFQLYLPLSVPETEVDDGPVFALPDSSPTPAENIIYDILHVQYHGQISI